jgi:ribose transport system ATP-binding protein
LSFTAYPGECVVILAADDSAAEDIAGIVSDEIRISSGGVLVNERPAYAKDLRGSVAVIDEKPVQRMLFPHLSYLDNLCFTADKRVRGIWRSRRIRRSVIKEYYPIVGENIYVRDIRELSVKELYRLIYCRIFFQRPSAVVCVKPFSTIDLSLRQYVCELIRRFQDKGMAVIILSSSASGALSVADRLITIKDGRVTAELSREELLSFPRQSML